MAFDGRMAEIERDYGLLGRDDNRDNFLDMPRGFLGMEKMLNFLLKELDKQFNKVESEREKSTTRRRIEIPDQGISISISSFDGVVPGINNGRIIKQISMPANFIDEGIMKKIAELPKKEAEARVRRMNDRVIYDIEVPGVSSIKNVIVTKLENSIEIKAFSKDVVYFKNIQIGLPVMGYSLRDGRIMLELKAD